MSLPSPLVRAAVAALLALAGLVAAPRASAQLTRTPALTEGPYYTFNSSQRLSAPTDQDNDLTTIGTSTTRASGTLFLLSGQLVNTAGTPVPNAVIELWQADNGGVYYHSADSLVSRRDTAFQGFGQTTTDASGNYAFRTVRPGLYTGRIRHFHFKVKMNGSEVLTSQFVFEDQRASFSSDNVAGTLSGASLEAIVINPVNGTDSSGATAQLASKQIVVNVTVTATGTAPTITASPSPGAVAPGDSISFAVAATGTAPLTYQWRKDGVAIAGATSATYVIGSATSASAGQYTAVVTNAAGSATSATAALLVTTPTNGNALVNLSTRAYLPSSSGVIIAGFVVQGTDGKRVLVRAVGPALADFNVAGAVADPRLEVFDTAGNPLASNDSWDSALATTFSSLGAFALPSGSKDAALTVNLVNGGATAQVRGTAAGVALVEAYDTASSATSKLINLSSRAFVGTDSAVLVAGFVLNGTGGRRLLIRGVGPRLANFGVTGTLANPKLEIYNAAGVKLAENDNWDATLASTFTKVGAFDLVAGSNDAALLVTLPAGASYTAVVTGVGGLTGEALVELYDVP